MPKSGAEKPINISKGYEEITSDLDRPGVEFETVDGICKTACTLLDEIGKPVTINGIPAIATPQSIKADWQDRELFARLANPRTQDKPIDNLVSIIFCEDENFPKLTTKYSTALSFRAPTGAFDVHLSAGTGLKIADDDPRYIKLAGQIVQGLSSASVKDRAEALETAERERKEAEQAQIKRQQKRRQVARRTAKTIITVATTAGLLYNHLLYESDHLDAKVAGVPMPAPVEWIVDWANHKDHVAQGFSEPHGALTLHPGDKVSDIPVITYDTDGVVSTTVNGTPVSHRGGESRPGLYRSSFSRLNSTGGRFDESGCYVIGGDYTHDRTSVFTTNAELNKTITLKVGAKTLSVCLRPTIPMNFKGDLFLYEKS